jgi:hypothetical protein
MTHKRDGRFIVSVSMKEELHDQLMAACAASDLPITVWVREAIKSKLATSQPLHAAMPIYWVRLYDVSGAKVPKYFGEYTCAARSAGQAAETAASSFADCADVVGSEPVFRGDCLTHYSVAINATVDGMGRSWLAEVTPSPSADLG